MAPDCDPGAYACGISLDQNKVYQCVQDQSLNTFSYVYDGTTNCADSSQVCSNGQCSSTFNPIDCTQTQSGQNACSSDPKYVYQCRGGVYVKIEYCSGNSICVDGRCMGGV